MAGHHRLPPQPVGKSELTYVGRTNGNRASFTDDLGRLACHDGAHLAFYVSQGSSSMGTFWTVERRSPHRRGRSSRALRYLGGLMPPELINLSLPRCPLPKHLAHLLFHDAGMDCFDCAADWYIGFIRETQSSQLSLRFSLLKGLNPLQVLCLLF